MDGLRAVNVYAIETEEGLTLVDGGWALDESRKQLDESLAAIGPAVADITRFLVTHVHRDHYTQAVTVRREVGVARQPRARRQGHAGRVRERDARRGPDRARRSAAPAPTTLADGWRAMSGQRPDPSTVGVPRHLARRRPAAHRRHPHDRRGLDTRPHPGALRLRRPDAGLLFAGDHVLPTITPSIGFEPAYADPAARRLPRLPREGPRDARPAAAARARGRGAVHARPRRRAGGPPRRTARALPGLRARRAGPRRTPSRATCPGRGTGGTSTSSTCSTPRSPRWRRWRTSSCWPRGARSRAPTTAA